MHSIKSHHKAIFSTKNIKRRNEYLLISSMGFVYFLQRKALINACIFNKNKYFCVNILPCQP